MQSVHSFSQGDTCTPWVCQNQVLVRPQASLVGHSVSKPLKLSQRRVSCAAVPLRPPVAPPLLDIVQSRPKPIASSSRSDIRSTVAGESRRRRRCCEEPKTFCQQSVSANTSPDAPFHTSVIGSRCFLGCTKTSPPPPAAAQGIPHFLSRCFYRISETQSGKESQLITSLLLPVMDSTGG